MVQIGTLSACSVFALICAEIAWCSNVCQRDNLWGGGGRLVSQFTRGAAVIYQSVQCWCLTTLVMCICFKGLCVWHGLSENVRSFVWLEWKHAISDPEQEEFILDLSFFLILRYVTVPTSWLSALA